MSQFYIRSTQQLATESEVRALFPNTSMPQFLGKETLDQLGVDVVLQTPQPTPTDLQIVELTGVQTDALGNVVQKWELKSRFVAPGKAAKEKEYLAQLLEAGKTAKLSTVDSVRLQKEKAGVLYTFPDGDGVVQTRNDADLRNVMAVTTSALVLKAHGVDAAVIPFRDEGDMIHMLSADQAIAMGMAVQGAISATYQWSWAKKAEIAAVTTKAALEAITLE